MKNIHIILQFIEWLYRLGCIVEHLLQDSMKSILFSSQIPLYLIDF